MSAVQRLPAGHHRQLSGSSISKSCRPVSGHSGLAAACPKLPHRPLGYTPESCRSLPLRSILFLHRRSAGLRAKGEVTRPAAVHSARSAQRNLLVLLQGSIPHQLRGVNVSCLGVMREAQSYSRHHSFIHISEVRRIPREYGYDVFLIASDEYPSLGTISCNLPY